MRLYFIFISLLFCTSVFAQQHFFLYIQTENKQPFYIKLNGKIYSSSATGYVVIPKLIPDAYQMQVGFNKDVYPEQQIRCIVDKDAGYLLKNYAEKGWGLLNLQSGEVVMNSAAKKPEDGDDDAFSKTLSQVVNTPDLKSSEPAKPVPEKLLPKDKGSEPVKIEPVISPKSVSVSSPIKQLLNNADKTGRQMVYSDGLDTIRLFIPGEVVAVEVPAPATEVKIKNEEKVEEKKVLKEAEKKEEPQVSPVTDTSSVLKTPGVQIEIPVAVSNNCGLLASHDDFLKLRKKMAAEKTEEAMISTARKLFKTRCFATEQIRNLIVLFLTDEGRYKFLDASYPYVHDVAKFGSLESTLSDNYYRNRFKALISR